MANTRFFFPAPSARMDETGGPAAREAEVRRAPDHDPADPFADEPKWPAWKVTVFVIVFCGAFWAGIGYLAIRLMS